MKPFIFVSFLFLSACMSTQDIQNRNAAKCSSYGFSQGTNAFGQCMMRLEKEADDAYDCLMERLTAFGNADPSKGFSGGMGASAKAGNECRSRRNN